MIESEQVGKRDFDFLDTSFESEANRVQHARTRANQLSTLGFLASLFVFVCCLFASADQSHVTSVSSASTPTAIEDVQLGWRVVGENPLGKETWDEEPDELTWRKVILNLRSEDGALIEISYLRPHAWFEKWRAEVGRTIDLALSEPGKSGIATVVAIEPCPQINRGNGLVVTGLYRHLCQEGELVRVEFEGDLKPITGTYNHPFWSETRGDFVNAVELEPGERLLCTDDEIVKVKSVTQLAGVERVFNLETHNHHVYAVGNAGMIVHNVHGAKPDDDAFFFHGTRSNQTVTSKGLDIDEVTKRKPPEPGFSLSNRETATGFSQNPLREADGAPTLLKIRKSTIEEKGIVLEDGIFTDAGEVRILPIDFDKFKPGDFEID